MDLLITNYGIYQETNVSEEGETLGSDHQVIVVQIKKKVQRWNRIKYTTRKYETDSIEWRDVRLSWFREEEAMKRKMTNARSIEEKYKTLIESIKDGMERIGIKERKNKSIEGGNEERIDKERNKETRKSTTVGGQYPWWDKKCKEKKEARKKAVKDFIKRPDELHWTALKKEEKEMKEMIRDLKNKAWEEMATSVDHRTKGSDIWRRIKGLQRGFDIENNTCVTIEEVRQLEEKEINKILQKPMEEENEIGEVEEGGIREDMRNHIQIEEEERRQDIKEWEVEMAIQKSNDKSAPGENGIDYKIIKNMTVEYKKEMLKLFNEIWRTQDIPREWKKAIIIFLDKTNKKSLRPISLTDCMGKVMERIVSRRLTEWAEYNKIMDEGQNGFRRGRSTMDNLAILTSEIRKGFENGRETLAVFIDVKGAYDHVDHNILMMTLRQKGCPEGLVKYIEEWISNRKVKCIRRFDEPMEGAQWRGLPQGAILSPILYNIYTANLTRGVKEGQINILQYADDIVIYTTSNARQLNVERVRKASEKLIRNLKDIKLDIAEEKTKVMNFAQGYNTTRRGKISINIGNGTYMEEESTRFLGISLDRRLRFEEHTDMVVQKARKRLNMLRYIGHIKKGANPETMIMLYKSLIRSVIEYGVSIYYTNNKKNKEKIGKMQNAGIRTAMGYRMSTPINVKMVEAGVMDITNRIRLITNKYVAKQRRKRESKVLDAIRGQEEGQEEEEEEERHELGRAYRDTEQIEGIMEREPEMEGTEIEGGGEEEREEEEEDNEEIWKRIMDWELGKNWKEMKETRGRIPLIRNIKEKLEINKEETVEIYTDGSKIPNSRSNGVGIVIKEANARMEQWKTRGLRISNMATIYTTEAVGIEKAIEIADNELIEKDVIIFTDALSVLQGIKNIERREGSNSENEDRRVRKIRDLLIKREKQNRENEGEEEQKNREAKSCLDTSTLWDRRK